MDKIYTDGTYLSNNPTWDIEDSPWKAKQILKILANNSITPNTICEVGCGAGEILNQLSKMLNNKIKYSGYDISPQAIKLAESIKNEKIEFYNKDILNVATEIYDVLLIIDVVEHIENYIDFLRKVKEKGKYKIFHFPLDFSVLTTLNSQPLLDTRKRVGHLHYFTKDITIAVLKDSGYEVVDYFYTDASFVRPANTLKIKLLQGLRKICFKINKDFAVKMLGGYSLLVLTK